MTNKEKHEGQWGKLAEWIETHTEKEASIEELSNLKKEIIVELDYEIPNNSGCFACEECSSCCENCPITIFRERHCLDSKGPYVKLFCKYFRTPMSMQITKKQAIEYAMQIRDGWK